MPTDQLYFWAMAFTRAGGLLALMPVFSGRNIPMRVRLSIGAFLGWVGGSVVPVGAVAPPAGLATLIMAFSHEVLIGLLMGMAVRIVFFALETAGQIMATEIGLTMSSQLDPISQNNNTSVTTALTLFGSLLFFISGAHHAVLAAFTKSFLLIPPGKITFERAVGQVFVDSTSNIFLIALQMAAPLMAINFLVTFAFAILGKVAPGINAFQESFGVRLFAGLILFSLTFGLAAQLVLSHLRAVPETMLRLLP